MNQFENMEVFVASEDAVEPVGKADEVEFWTYDNLPGELILRGFNVNKRLNPLQAENECLRKDVEFYKNRVVEVEREFEIDEGSFEDLLIDFNRGDLSLLDVAELLKIALVRPEPTEADRIQEFINDWDKAPPFKSLAQHLAAAGFTVPDKETTV